MNATQKADVESYTRPGHLVLFSPSHHASDVDQVRILLGDHPPDLGHQRIEIYDGQPREVVEGDNGCGSARRFSLDEFLSMLSSLYDDGMDLRYALRFASVSSTATTSSSSLDDNNLLVRIRAACELSDAEAQIVQRTSLGAYICATQSSVEDLEARRFVSSKLGAATSVRPLVQFLCAMQRRVPPPFSALAWECARKPLLTAMTTPMPMSPPASTSPTAVDAATELFLPENVLATLTRIADGHISTQSTVFAAVEAIALMSASVSDVVGQWTNAQRSALRPAGHPQRKIGASDESTRRMVSFINRVHKLEYTLSRRLDGGRSVGAYLLRKTTVPAGDSAESGGGGGESGYPIAVLKWNTDKEWAQQVLQAGPIITRACALGYPTPPWLAFGVSPSGYPYQVQAFAAGAPVAKMDTDVIDALLPVFEMQRNFYHLNLPQTDRKTLINWTARDRRLVFEDIRMHDRLMTKDDDIRAVYISLMSWVVPLAITEELTTTDLVHGDLNPTNILVDHENGKEQPRIALVDSEGVGCGSVMHDVAAVLFTTLKQEAVAGSGSGSERLLGYAVNEIQQPKDFHIAMASRIMIALAYADDASRPTVTKLCREILQRVQACCCVTHDAFLPSRNRN
jgi:aminoglycoside phosphotransferase (APT) family kinase protein